MSDDGTRAIARVESHAVPASQAAVAHDHEPPKHRAAHQDQRAATPRAVPTVPSARRTELAFEPDPASARVVVQVVDRETGSVVRSFPITLPGGEAATDQDPPRGALVDAKA